jgi:hypothetical protein
MKANKRLILVVIIAALALLAVNMTVSARSTFKSCSGTEYLVSVIDEGVWTFPNGNIHVRGRVSQYQEQSSCPEIEGVLVSTMNANWDQTFSGPMWGTSRNETSFENGGVWDCSWFGKSNPDGSYSYTAQCRGISGSVSGLRSIIEAFGWPGQPATFTATIRDPVAE